MIRFTCPKCQTLIEAQAPPPGQPLICPGCSRRLHVQSSGITKKTAPAPAPAPAAAPPPPAATPGMHVPTYEYERPRSRKKKSNNMPLIIGLAVGGGGLVVALIVIIIVVLAQSGGKQPSVAAKNTNPSARRTEPTTPPPEDRQPPPRENPPRRENPPQDNSALTNRGSGSEEEEKPAPRSGTKTGDSGTASKPPPASESPSSDSGTTTVGSASGTDVYNYVLKSAVLILILGKEGIGNGSGALIDKENRVVITNHHVVDDSIDLAVFFPTYRDGKLVMARDNQKLLEQVRAGKAIKAKVLVADARKDLALIQLDRLPEGVEALPLSKQQTSTGQSVHSVGNPGSSGALWVYTSGTVRAVYHNQWANRVRGKIIQRDCEIVETQSPTNPGDSGGPLVNDRGEMVGITHGGSSSANLLSTFIDITEVRKLIEDTFRRESLTWKPASRTALAKRSGGGGGGDVTSLIKDLESKEARTRALAANRLGEMGPDAKIAVPGLIRALKDEDDLTRRTASDALIKIGAPDRRDLPALTEYLKDSNTEVRRQAATAIGELGPDARPAVAALIDLVKTEDVALRQIVLRTLGKAGSGSRDTVVPVLSEALKDDSKDVRVAAAEGLTSLSTGQASDLPIFAALLKNQQDPEIRVQGARGLAKLGREAKPAIGELIAAGKDGDRTVRKAVVEALAPFGADAKGVVGLFTEALKESDKPLQKAALQALAKVGPEGKTAVPAIRDLLKESDLKKEAVFALGKIGPGAKDAVPALAEILKDGDKDEKLETMTALIGIGPGADKAVPNLILLFEERELTFRRKVTETLAKIGKPAINHLVNNGLKDNNPYVRWGACDALGDIGTNANSRPVLAALAYVGTNDNIVEVQDAAKKAYVKITGK